jgi:hypothetical protein
MTATETVSAVLAALPPAHRRRVNNAVASSMIEGDIPDTASVALLADLAIGKITGEQYRAAILADICSGRR